MTYLAFDMDGTLFDCSDIVVSAFQKGITVFIDESQKKIDLPDKEALVSLLGVPTSEIFTSLFSGLSKQEYQRLDDLCMDALAEEVESGGGYVYPGTVEVIKNLKDKDYKMVIASNGRLAYLKAVLKKYGLDKYFEKDIIVLNDEIITKDQIVETYKKGINSDDSIIMIGDRESDLKAAVSNNIPFIGCAFGHANQHEISGERWIATSMKEIPDLVVTIENSLKECRIV